MIINTDQQKSEYVMEHLFCGVKRKITRRKFLLADDIANSIDVYIMVRIDMLEGGIT